MGLTKYLAGDLDFYGIITKSKAPCIYNSVLDPFFKILFIILSLYRYRLKIHQTMGVSVSSFDCCGTCCLCSYNKIWLLKPHLSSQWQSLICVTVTRDKDVWLNHLPSSSICCVLNSCRHLKPDSFFYFADPFFSAAKDFELQCFVLLVHGWSAALCCRVCGFPEFYLQCTSRLPSLPWSRTLISEWLVKAKI